MKIVCPNCGKKVEHGRFCEKCGNPFAAESDTGNDRSSECRSSFGEEPTRGGSVNSGQSDFSQMPILHQGDCFSNVHEGLKKSQSAGGNIAFPQTENATSLFFSDQSGPELMVDQLCVQFENLSGIVRFLFNPGNARDGLENIVFKFENQLTGESVSSRMLPFLNRSWEFSLPFPAQRAGATVWSVTGLYEISGVRHQIVGDMQMVVIQPREAQTIADNLCINISNNINNGNASDVHVSQRALEDLTKLASAENPFDELRRIISGRTRSWCGLPLIDSNTSGQMPPMPPRAKTERITLDFGTHRVTFLGGRTIRFGRNRDVNDISLRPAASATEDQKRPYCMISRAHCHFEHQGQSVVICDGQRDERQVLVASSGGTFWNGVRIDGSIRLNAGDRGVVSFAGSYNGAISLDVKVCKSAGDCSSCPHAGRQWCGDGLRSSLMLTRRDGIPEKFIAVWSCFRLEEADPSFNGVLIFRKDGAFAWRKGRKCGWIIPGTSQQTDFGTVTVN